MKEEKGGWQSEPALLNRHSETIKKKKVVFLLTVTQRLRVGKGIRQEVKTTVTHIKENKQKKKRMEAKKK